MRTDALALLTDIVEAAREHERIRSVHREPVEILDPERQPATDELGDQVPELAARVCRQVLRRHPGERRARASADTTVDFPKASHQSLHSGHRVALVVCRVWVVALQK